MLNTHTSSALVQGFGLSGFCLPAFGFVDCVATIFGGFTATRAFPGDFERDVIAFFAMIPV